MGKAISSQAAAKASEGSTTRRSSLTPLVLREMYARLTVRQMAEKLGVATRTLGRHLHRAGIKLRTPGERIETSKLRDKKWLFGEYVTNNKSAEQISEEMGSWPATVIIWLNRHDIPVRSTNKGRKFRPEVVENMSAAKRGLQLGDKNPNWRGGKVDPSARARVSYAHKMWSRKVRERDGRCVSCGAIERLQAHHVLSWHKHTELRYDVSNGVTLCVRCHQKVHGFPFPSWAFGKTSTSAERPNGR